MLTNELLWASESAALVLKRARERPGSTCPLWTSRGGDQHQLDALPSWQGEAGAHRWLPFSLTGSFQNWRPALAGIIGARREFTAAMISSVSIPCR